MKPEKIIITSVVRGRKRVRVWEPSSPMGFGHPMRWVLERTSEGIRVRSLQGKAQVVQFDDSVIDGKEMIALPDSDIQIQLKRARPIRPAYLSDKDPARGNALPLLMAFSGVRREVIGSSQIHSAYIASRKGKPVFTVQNTPNGVKFTLLASKVHLKKSGHPSVTGTPGESWKLSREDLTNSTITLGWHWWRFKFIQPEALDRALEDRDEEDSFSKKTIGLILALLALFFVSTFFYRPAQKPAEKEIPIEIPKGQKIVIYRSLPVPEMPHAEEATQKPEPKAGNNSAPKAVVKHADEHALAQATKPKHSKTPEQKHVIHPPKPTTQVAGGRSGVKSRAARIAEAQAQLLKEALGGIAKDAPSIGSSSAGASKMSGIFSGKGPVVSETQVRPGFGGTDAKVGTMGGNGFGKAGASGDGVGYAEGAHGTVSGQGDSLVSAGFGGSFVDQGLSKAEVGAVIHEHMDEIRYCHESAMLTNPGIQGRLVVDFSINPAGVVESESVQSSSLLPDTTIQSCLLKRLKTWKFPRPHGGVHVSVSYPFLFKTLSRDD